MRRRTFLALGLVLGCSKSSSSSEGEGEPAASRSSLPWQPDHVVASKALAAELGKPPAERPKIVHVGPATLFRSVRVPGAEHPGEAGTAEGLAALERWLAPLERKTDLVVYCGCCPYKNCPNIRPAFAKAVALGFTKVRVLDLPTTLKADWTDLGLPVERG